MKPLQTQQARTIHPRALAALGHEACIVALGVARDLRSGVIPPEDYDQREWCGSACCIAGHIAKHMGIGFIASPRVRNLAHYRQLFCGGQPSDPTLAADAIERYVYDGSEHPWIA